MRRMVAGCREHVVPLQHLVQQDPVDEPAKPDAQQDPGDDEPARQPFRGAGADSW
jgi:hypothetical protein